MIKPTLILSMMLVFSASLWATDPELKPRLGDLPETSPDTSHSKKRNGETEPSIEDNHQIIRDVVDDFYQKGLKAFQAGDLATAEGYFDRVLVIRPQHRGARVGIDQIMKTYDQSTPLPEEPKTDPTQKLIQNRLAAMESKIASGEDEQAAVIAREILAIDPNHNGTRRRQAQINRRLHLLAVNRAQEREEAGDEQGAIDAYLLAMNYGKDESLAHKVASLRQALHEKNKVRSNELYLEALAAVQLDDAFEAIKYCRRALALDPKNLQAQRMLERLASISQAKP
jgi:tetratricopeptide (TPR) repeat protein